MTTKTLAAADLAQFHGAERWFRHSLARDVVYTEGVQYLAENGGAYWLIDEIALVQRDLRRRSNRAADFQVWKLVVAEDRSATLTCEDGDDLVFMSKAIPFTDFPLPEVMLYVENNVVLLPSEH